MMEFIFEAMKREFNLGAGLDGIMAGTVFLGMFVGALFWGLVSDRYGYVHFIISLFHYFIQSTLRLHDNVIVMYNKHCTDCIDHAIIVLLPSSNGLLFTSTLILLLSPHSLVASFTSLASFCPTTHCSRAFSYFITSLFVGTFGMITAGSYHAWLFFTCRFLVGFGFGGSHTAFTLWQEFVPFENRGTMLLLNQLFWTLGALLEAVLAWAIIPAYDHSYSWRILMVVSAILPLLTATFYIVLPESPRYLLVTGKREEAAQILRDVARANGHEYPEELDLVVRDDGGNRHQGELKMLLHPAILGTTFLLLIIWCTDTFVYYGSAFITPKVFENTSLYTAAIITTCAEIPGVFLPMATMDTLGRKITLMLLFLTSSLFMWLIAYVNDKTTILVCLCIGRMCMSSAFTVTFIYTSEIYPTAVRSTGLGFNSAMSRLAGFVTTYVATETARSVSSTLYAVFALGAAVAAFLLPYDTKQRPIYDTMDQFERSVEKKEDRPVEEPDTSEDPLRTSYGHATGVYNITGEGDSTLRNRGSSSSSSAGSVGPGNAENDSLLSRGGNATGQGDDSE